MSSAGAELDPSCSRNRVGVGGQLELDFLFIGSVVSSLVVEIGGFERKEIRPVSGDGR